MDQSKSVIFDMEASEITGIAKKLFRELAEEREYINKVTSRELDLWKAITFFSKQMDRAKTLEEAKFASQTFFDTVCNLKSDE